MRKEVKRVLFCVGYFFLSFAGLIIGSYLTEINQELGNIIFFVATFFLFGSMLLGLWFAMDL